ncbi:MAG: 4Fe-4S dicluster domain-containing protein [Actinobacteria bacterium]|nr:4Fe-4S dicluster domain-containing protein [Actinomycetota bacterium]
MTTIYDPKHPLYLDEADTRKEMERVFDLCHGCRLCFKFCPSFPTLFSYVDQHDDQDAGKMTPAQQDHVVDECFQCKLCYVMCPYIPELHEWALDFPRLMLRADANIGKDLVKVYEHNGIECSIAGDAGCCGAPFLHSGDIDSFTKVAVRNVKMLADEVRSGNDIVVPQPTCSYVLKKDYVDYVGGPDAKLVSEHTFDAAEYLVKLHKTEGSSLDTEFTGTIPETVTYHTPCHLRAQNIGLKSRDLMKLTGAKIKLVQQCSGIDGMWGLRAENAHLSLPIGEKLGQMVKDAGGDVVAGDCHLANTAINEQTGTKPVHPLQMIARAYGIPEEN